MSTPATQTVAQRNRELLAAVLRKKAREQTVVTQLSHGQRALWYLYCSAPHSAAYHVSFSARIVSMLDIPALRRSFQSLLERHSALRAQFKVRDGVPVQEIPGHCEVAFTVIDASSLSEVHLREAVAHAYKLPFDLEKGPAFRVDLFSRSATEHVLLVTVHHIVYDAWSLWLNLDEIRQLYAADIAGTTSALKPLEHTYRDYIRRQEEMLAGDAGERLWSFWKTELAGELPRLDLPADYPRPPAQTYAGASLPFALSPEQSKRLRNLAQRHSVTPFALLLAAFQVLLHRYSGQSDILVGSPTSGRGDPRFAGIAGYFVNPVVLRADLSGNPAFSTLLRQTAERAARALEHQDFPFPLLVQRLQPRRDPSVAPVFQVSFVYQKPQRASGTTTTDWLSWSAVTGTRASWGGLDIEYFEQPQQEGQFDLELEIQDASDALRGVFKYNTDLFAPPTIARMSRYFMVLLESIGADPERTIRSLPLVEAAEADHLRRLAPEIHSERASARCLHQTFEEQARATPTAIAVTCDDRQLTYAELNSYANRLAHYLLELGVARESRVGICLERSWTMIVAMLATSKAGAAYVPVSPEAPPERNAFILRDSGISVLLTQSSLVDRCSTNAGSVVVLLDADWESIQRRAARNPAVDVDCDSLLYVIYTSGSTGQPKGALVSHFNVARLFTATRQWFKFGARDVWTLFHAFAFDFSVWEIWGALLHGGRLVVVPYLLSRSPEEFVDLVRRENVTVLNQTPSAFLQFMEAQSRLPAATLPSLQWIIFGGEALDVKMLERWYARHDESRPRLVNMYGITETTVHVTYRPLGLADVYTGKSVIGRPIPDLQIHLLDEELEPVPVGLRGEIYVEGAGVCRGYLSRESLTKERFIEIASGDSRMRRLYRTGDLARRISEDDVEYLGRIDDQVKIRGFRIELGEIEAAINQGDGVKTCTVVALNEKEGKRLVAYVVATTGVALDIARLREALVARLPDYMVPSAFVVLPELPLNSNGKIDRRALPVPSARASSAQGFVPPRDSIELRLARHWQNVLHLNAIGVHDNFFDVGGHSLLAVNLLSRIETEFGRRLPMATLFRKPTIEQLGELLRREAQPQPFSHLVSIQPAGSRAPLFCVAGGGGSVLYYYPLARRLDADRPFIGLQGFGLEGECEPFTRVEDIAAAYLDELLAAQPDGPFVLGGHCFGGLVAFELCQQLMRRGRAVERLILLDVPARYPEAHFAAVDEVDWILKFAAVVKESTQLSLGLEAQSLRQLDSSGRLQLLNEKLQAAGFLPPHAELAKARGLLRVFAANSTIRYEPRATRPVPIVLLRAAVTHPDYDFSSADDPGSPMEESTLGWCDYALGPVEVHLVPGNHITMLSEPQVGRLAEKLNTCLYHRE
jgi:amino acid adenylation domain-containing protein